MEAITSLIFRIISESMAVKESCSSGSAPPDRLNQKDLISLFLNSKVDAFEGAKGTAFVSEVHHIRETNVKFACAGNDTMSNNHAVSFNDMSFLARSQMCIGMKFATMEVKSTNRRVDNVYWFHLD